MRPTAGIPVGWRLPVLVAGGLALLTGLYAALLLLGFLLPSPGHALEDVHGPVMVFGFIGTLIAAERAVALGARWGLLAPASSGLGGIVLAVTGPGIAGKLLFAAAAVALLGGYGSLWRRQHSVAILAQALGAAAWYAAVLLWLGGFPVSDTVPWLASFVVATIAGERLELAHIGLTRPDAERWFLVVLVALVAGGVSTTVWPDLGGHLFGVALLGMVAWLASFDVARRTIRTTGLPRYVATGLLTGYGWLALAGLLWAGAGRITSGPTYDATLHAVFLGFVMSLVFVHAPVILPALLHRPLPYHPVLYLPLALLHVSLLLRVAVGDGLGVTWVWRWSGVLNVVSVLGFAASAVALAMRPRTGGVVRG